MNNHKIHILSAILIAITSCSTQDNAKKEFDEEQIKNLEIGNTQISTVTTDSTIEIDVDKYLGENSFDFEQLISEAHTIKLETSSKSVLGGIYKLILTDNNIYIYDNYRGGSVAIFKSDGSFIKRISRGHGPGEIYRVWDIDFDTEHKELYVYQHPFFLIYNENGDYLRDIRLPLGFYNFKVTHNGYILKTTHTDANLHIGDIHKFSLFTLDKSLKLRHAALPNITDIGYSEYCYITSTRNKVYISQPFEDYIYSINDTGTIIAEYLLKYDNHHIDINEMAKNRFNSEKIRSQSNGFYHHGRHLETTHNSLFFLKNRRGNCAIYRNKTTGAMAGGAIQNLSLSNLPPTPFPIATFGDYFISVIAPYEYKKIDEDGLLSPSDIENLASMDEDDNPVLLLFKIGNL